MQSTKPKAVHLKDYTPVTYLIDAVSLNFRLDPEATRVSSRLSFRPRSVGAARFAKFCETFIVTPKGTGRSVSDASSASTLRQLWNRRPDRAISTNSFDGVNRWPWLATSRSSVETTAEAPTVST